ncbi:MAG: PQQ-binding-like beta-propeller repeat protein [Tannerellaceae bacterium]|nr:PQQ-binding-like beta-propeller repeat protein [Tannerellaceae bacterium]
MKDGQLYVLYIKAFFTDGTSTDTKKPFIYRKTNPEQVKFAGNHTNLLGNPRHVGCSVDTLSTSLQLSWIRNVGANIFMSSPLIYNQHIYVGTVDENLRGEGGITSLDGKTGIINWKYTTRNSIKNTIAIEDGLLFAQDTEGYLYAIDADTGVLVWEKKLQNNTLPALVEGLATHAGRVYAGTGNGLSALECKTGKEHWVNTGWKQHEGTTTTITVGENVVISGAQWGGLYGNDIRTGEMLWRNNKNGLTNRGASAAVYGNLLYITSQSSLFILNASTGQVIVRKELPVSVDVTSTPLLTDNRIIFGTADEGVMALDRETLDEVWRFKTNPALVYTAPYTRYPVATVETSPVSSGNIAFTGASDGTLYGLDISTGTCIWKHEMGTPCFATVAISGNTLIAVDFGGNVYAFTAQ